MDTMNKRVRVLGVALAVVGLGLAGVGFLYGVPTANAGLDSAQAMYEAQGVTLSYNEEGQLVDRGTPEAAQNILRLLQEDWGYPVNHANLDPNDPLVNTRDELMFQYATITYHVLHGTRTVTLTEEDVPITYRGVTYSEPGEYDIAVGDYFANLDRTHPIEGQLREAWSPSALALTSALAGGHANQAVGEVALMTSLAMGGIGVLFFATGSGLVWVGFARAVPVPASSRARATREPARTPARRHYAQTPQSLRHQPVQAERGRVSPGGAPPVHRVFTDHEPEGPVRARYAGDPGDPMGFPRDDRSRRVVYEDPGEAPPVERRNRSPEPARPARPTRRVRKIEY